MSVHELDYRTDGDERTLDVVDRLRGENNVAEVLGCLARWRVLLAGICGLQRSEWPGEGKVGEMRRGSALMRPGRLPARWRSSSLSSSRSSMAAKNTRHDSQILVHKPAQETNEDLLSPLLARSNIFSRYS